jgi:hypothetical protein
MQPKPSAPPVKEATPVRVTEPSYRSVTVDTRFTPLANLIRHIEGSSWSVNYYAQVLNQDSELGAQQLDRAAIYQQYVLIELLELKVTVPLAGEQDPETKSMKYSGTAMVYAGTGVIPNKGDMFLADIGDGRQGVFVVTSAEQKSYLAQSCYQLTYDLKSYDEAGVLADLETKTVKKTRYVKEFVQYGQNPQVLSEDYAQLIDFNKRYKELLGLYLRDFFSVEEQTLIIPGQTEVSYDPFLVKALLDWVSTDEHPFVSRLRLLNVDGDKIMATPTLWDCLSQMATDSLPMAVQQVRLMPSHHWRRAPQYGGVYFSGVQRVVYPIDGRTDVDAAYDHQCEATGGEAIKTGGQRFSDLARLIPDTNLNGFVYSEVEAPNLPDIVPVTQDPYYVFTRAFYYGEEPLSSNLERLALSAIQQEAIDKTILSRLAINATKWENLERFYYIPVLLALLKVSMRTN